MVLGRRSPSAPRIDTPSGKLTVCLIKEPSVVTSGVRVRVRVGVASHSVPSRNVGRKPGVSLAVPPAFPVSLLHPGILVHGCSAQPPQRQHGGSRVVTQSRLHAPSSTTRPPRHGALPSEAAHFLVLFLG